MTDSGSISVQTLHTIAELTCMRARQLNALMPLHVLAAHLCAWCRGASSGSMGSNNKKVPAISDMQIRLLAADS